MLLSVALLSFLLVSFVHAQSGSAPDQNFIGSTPSQRHIINSTQASSVISAAEAEASSANLPSNIAVTDAYGNLVAFLKTDNAFLVSTEISMKKARTVTLFNGQYTTEGLYNVTQPGNSLYGTCAGSVAPFSFLFFLISLFFRPLKFVMLMLNWQLLRRLIAG